MKRIKEILTRNLSLKLLSVVIAFFVWLAVVNVSDPQITERKEITLEVVNGEVMSKAGLSYEIEGKRNSVTVSYQVRTQDRMNINQSDFRAYIDLADYYPATGTVPVYVEVLNNKDYLVNSQTARPAVVRIRTEQIQEKEFELQIHTSGTMAEGYEVDQVVLSRNKVTVEGPESVIGRINSVGVEINIEEGQSTASSGTTVPVFYDANGNKLTLDERVSVNVPEIDYKVNVVKIRQIPLEFEVGGQAADGYRYMGLDSSAQAVAVAGPDELVSQVGVIRIPASALDLDNAMADRTITVNVEDYLPDPQMRIPWNRQVVVNLRVRKLEQRVIEIPTNRIIREGEADSYYYDYDTDSVQVTVEGLPEDLESLDASDMILEMDVAGLDVGSHRGSLTIEGLREDFQVVDFSAFQVLVSSKEMGPGMATAPGSEAEEESGLDSAEVREAIGQGASAAGLEAQTSQEGSSSHESQSGSGESQPPGEGGPHGTSGPEESRPENSN